MKEVEVEVEVVVVVVVMECRQKDLAGKTYDKADMTMSAVVVTVMNVCSGIENHSETDCGDGSQYADTVDATHLLTFPFQISKDSHLEIPIYPSMEAYFGQLSSAQLAHTRTRESMAIIKLFCLLR